MNVEVLMWHLFVRFVSICYWQVAGVLVFLVFSSTAEFCKIIHVLTGLCATTSTVIL